MSTIRDFDRRAAAWLADGPSELSDRVLDAALREVHLTHQRRRWSAPWRTSPMSLRLGLAAAAIVVVVAGGILIAGGGRGLPPSASPTSAAPTAAPTTTVEATGTPAPLASMPPLAATFVSPWYGYQVSYPTGWQITPGQGPWPTGEELKHDNPHLDEIRGPVGKDSARLVGASIALPDGMGLEGFMAFASSGTCDAQAPLKAPVRIDGIEATVTLNGCHSLSELGGLIWDVVLVTGGRGYDFTLDGFLTAAEAQAWLDSIKLEPGAALAASPAPS